MACGERLIKISAPSPAPKKKGPSPVGAFFLALAKSAGFYGFYLGMQVLILVVYAIVVAVLSHSSGGDYMTAYYKYIHEISIAVGIATLAGYVLFFRIRKKSFVKEVSLKPLGIGSSFGMVIFGFSAQIIIGVLLSVYYSVFAPDADSTNEAVEMLFENGNVIVQILNVSILTGILEEVIFRGLIHKLLKKVMSVPLAIFLSSVLFGAAHMNLEQFFYTTLLGVLLALAYEKTGSLIAPILIHMSFNGSNFLIAYLNFESDLPYFAIFLASVGAFLVTAGMIFFTSKEPKNSLNPTEEI